MEKDDTVRMAKKCPYCGSVHLYRRIRLGGYRCLKCKQTCDHPTIEKVGRVL